MKRTLLRAALVLGAVAFGRPAFATQRPTPYVVEPGACQEDGRPLRGLFRDLNAAIDAGALAPETAPGGPVVATPDGLGRNQDEAQAPRSLEQAAARAKKLDVPFRVQEGPTCGLYALGMGMDFWHKQDPRNPVADVVAKDDSRHGAANFPPTDSRYLFDVAKQSGYFAESERIVHEDGGMFVAKELGELATQFGYRYRVVEPAGAMAIESSIDRGIPALVGFDVDYDGNPGLYGGKRAHWAVITGYFDYHGTRYVIAQHGWEPKRFLWKEADLVASMGQIQPTLGPKVVEVYPPGYRN